jgi:L-ascorbate metabolism protein UlaG (beta-lactamase superfamily)
MTPPRSDHFNGKTFFHPRVPDKGLGEVLKWKFTSRAARWPRSVELTPQSPPPAPHGDEIVATWIGHATFLLQTTHGNFLTDPVFSERASPVQWAGPRRTHAPGIAFEALPQIDAVLLSHDHYDHCDAPTLARLAAVHNPVFVAPLRHHDLLSAAGAKAIAELDWWQVHAFAADIAITFTPSQHWSNRFGTPRNHRLWGGFFLRFGAGPAAKRVWFCGDSGYDGETFRTIRLRCGAPDLAFIPIGAYEPRWFMSPVHMNPTEAIAAHHDVGARRSLAMHWGTFQLTDEAREAPIEALATARRLAGVSGEEFHVLHPGASFVI